MGIRKPYNLSTCAVIVHIFMTEFFSHFWEILMNYWQQTIDYTTKFLTEKTISSNSYEEWTMDIIGVEKQQYMEILNVCSLQYENGSVFRSVKLLLIIKKWNFGGVYTKMMLQLYTD